MNFCYSILLYIWSIVCFISIFYDIGSSLEENSKIFSGNKVKEFLYLSLVYTLFVLASFEPIHDTIYFRNISYLIFLAMCSVYFGVFYVIFMFLANRCRFFDRTPPLWAKKLASKDRIWKGVLFFATAKEFFRQSVTQWNLVIAS